MHMKKREETRYIVVMSTGTPPEDLMTSGQSYTKDIKDGFLGPCFHYFVEADGNVETGRELDHYAAGLKRYNKHSVVIKWSGGMNKRLKRLEDNKTEEQKAVIPDLVDELRELYPAAKVVTYEDLNKLK